MLMSKTFQYLIVILAIFISASACTVDGSNCKTDDDCSAGLQCKSGGGVFFGGGICMSPSANPIDDSLDTSHFVDSDRSIDSDYTTDSNFPDDTAALPPSDTDNSDTNDDADTNDDSDTNECVIDEDCGQSDEGEWDTCDGFQTACATAGLQTRQLHKPTCTDGVCSVIATTEQRDCARETNDDSCGPVNASEWSTCSFDGKKTRQVTTQTCQDSACTPRTTTEELPCACTNNPSCGAPTYGNWTSCSFETTCASTGEKKREVRTPTCQTNACTIVVSTQTESCFRASTTGNSCGQPSSAAWSTCTNPGSNTCATSGTRTQQIHTPTCQSDECVIVTTTNSQNCALSPPTSCGTPSYSNWSLCSYAQTCSLIGTQTRTKTTPTCQNQSCNGVQTTETQPCGARTTTDVVCGTSSPSPWSACSYVDTCVTTASSSRVVTTQVCNNGTCSGTKQTTEYDWTRCSRDTQHNPCDNGHAFGTCVNGCCNASCPQGQNCLQCQM